MPTAECSTFLAGSLLEAVSTTASNESPRLSGLSQEGWDSIEGHLLDWGINPEQFDEEGITPPSRATIQLAIRVASEFNKQGFRSPTRVVPDVRGGIAFEFDGKTRSKSFHILPDGRIEERHFTDNRLVAREIHSIDE